MTRLVPIALAALMLIAARPSVSSSARFVPVHVWVECGDEPLAAWQAEIALPDGVEIVGVEGGEHPSYQERPYHDSNAIGGERVILAAFDNGAATGLPSGRVRVATIHVHAEGDTPIDVVASLEAAATVDGRRIDADIDTTQGTLP